jgi:hypothetical protein
MTATIPNIASTLAVTGAPLELVTFDLYKDIHKGIRHGLFGVTAALGNVDPSNDAAVEATTTRLHDLVRFLVSHHEHEDEYVQPWIDQYVPDVAAVIPAAHESIEHQLAEIEVLADQAVGARPTDRRKVLHRLYLGFTTFTSDFLAHMAFEEVAVMPELAQALGVDKLIEINNAIVSSIPPEDMAYALSLMVPAMNVDDRTEVFGGMKANAPAEVFNGVFAYVGTLIPADDYVQLKTRLGIK